MIKLSASVSKKLPVPEIEYSSHCLSAGIEIELASDVPQDELKEKLRSLYSMLEESIDEQMWQGQISQEKPQNSPTPALGPTSNNGPLSSNMQNGRKATKAQVRAIYAIAEDKGYADERMKELLSGYGVEESSALSIGQASKLIDSLKSNGKE